MTTSSTLLRPRSAGYYEKGLWHTPLRDNVTYAVTSPLYGGDFRPAIRADVPHRVVYGIYHDATDPQAFRTVLAVARYHCQRGQRRIGLEYPAHPAIQSHSNFFRTMAEQLRREGCEVVCLLPQTPRVYAAEVEYSAALLALESFLLRDFSPRIQLPMLQTTLRTLCGPVRSERLLSEEPLTLDLLAFCAGIPPGDEPSGESYHKQCNLLQLRWLIQAGLTVQPIAEHLRRAESQFEMCMAETIRQEDVPVSFVGGAHLLAVARAASSTACNFPMHRIDNKGCMERRNSAEVLHSASLPPALTEEVHNLAHQVTFIDVVPSILSMAQAIGRRSVAELESLICRDPLLLDRVHFAMCGGAIGRLLGLPNVEKVAFDLAGMHFLHFGPSTAQQELERCLALFA